MSKEDQKRYLIIHGHFYQPPRENPWTERVDRQEGAAPYHDWNERIATECYHPNARSRRLDGYGRILRLVNNYEHISFNFGPTLLDWIEKRHPMLHGQIVEADAKSAARRSGHGNAIAQVYNHIIMPLASQRDQETQIRWGVHDFRRRFEREPAGIWLAETAINEVTLDLLIDFGFRFIILSPFQADRVKEIGGDREWLDVSAGNIMTGMPYRCFGSRKRRGRKKSIDIFFYDAKLSTDVSFNHLCRNGDSLADAILAAYERTGGDLVTIATDGEIYGHHEPFADMALSYLIDVAAEKRGIEMTNFPAYLNTHPEPAFEVQIKQGRAGEGTAWSCPHGVGRWMEDCGCSTGAPAGWNQKWRSPLRKGLDGLRDGLDGMFEKDGAAILADPWKARDEYIEVIEERSSTEAAAFVRDRAAGDPSESDIARGVSLLEAQRNALLMFTSCGWFFNDISGIETTQLMGYAARAIELADGDQREALESALLSELEKAASNVPALGTGADIYRRERTSASVSGDFLAGQFVLTRHLKCPGASPESFGYEFEAVEEDSAEFGDELVRTGLFSMVSPYSLERWLYTYALVMGPPAKTLCMVLRADGPGEYAKLRERLASIPADAGRDAIIDRLASLFAGQVFAMRDLFQEDRERILGSLASRQVDGLESRLEQLYLEDRDMLRLFSETRITAPAVIRVPAETVLSRRLASELEHWERTLDPAGLEGVKAVLGEADHYGVSLDRSDVSRMFSELLIEALGSHMSGIDEGDAEILIEFVNFGDDAGIAFDDHGVQNVIFDILTGPLENAVARLETSKPGSGDELGRIKKMLTLAKRFNFNVESYEKRIPV
jgi:alpha-amylase/alpha-mannosidase (GH57 family)